MVPFPMTLNES